MANNNGSNKTSVYTHKAVLLSASNYDITTEKRKGLTAA